MAFFSVQLAELNPRRIRSRATDVDLLSFSVLVASRDQGHGTALLPVWPGVAMTADVFNQAAAANGYPHTAANMSPDWIVGPLWVEDTERVEIVYAAVNTSDSQIPTARQEEVNRWTIKLTNIYLSLLVGEFVSALGLASLAEYIGGQAGGAVAAFLADPVGTLLGYRPPGPCNGTVFAGKQSFTGAELAARTITPGTKRLWASQEVRTWSCDITDVTTDAATHDTDVCGAVAETDVTLRCTRFENWSLKGWSDKTLAPGLRRMYAPAGGDLKRIFGLRV
jgi:hypothetical protein